jgi:hypothetical protein
MFLQVLTTKHGKYLRMSLDRYISASKISPNADFINGYNVLKVELCIVHHLSPIVAGVRKLT